MRSLTAVRWAGWNRYAPRNLAGPLKGTSPPELTLTYDPVLSRVRITAINLGSLAVTAVVDRSLDGVRWVTVRGGAEITLSATQALPDTLDDYEFPATGTVTYRVRSYNVNGGVEVTITGQITLALDGVWLRSTRRAFLNQQVTLGGPPLAPSRFGRGDAFEVTGRTLPVAVLEVGSGRSYQLRFRTDSDAAGQTLGYALASGDVLYLQGPTTAGVPAGGLYFLVREAVEVPIRIGAELRHFFVQAVEVTPPGPDVMTATSTWESVLAGYATWQDVLDGNPTWQDLLDLLGDPSEVIVP